MRHEVVRINPETASDWLSRPSSHNRRLDVNTVAKYSRAMTEGRWFEPTIDPIAFGPAGELLNGQHRLTAVVRAEWEGEMLVAFDVDPAMFGVIDTGRKRLSQQFVNAPSATAVTSIIRMVLWYDERYPIPPRGRELSFDNDEILKVATSPVMTSIIEASRSAEGVHNAIGLPRSTHGSVIYLARRQGANEELITTWLEGLRVGAGLDTDDPRLHLRNRLVGSFGSQIRRDTTAMWQLTVRAFNAWMQQRPLNRLLYEPKDTPPRIELVEPSGGAKKMRRKRRDEALARRLDVGVAVEA